MVLQIINLICVILAGLITGVFIAFVVFKLRKIDSQTEDIPKHHWDMGIYMNNIPQTPQNTLRVCSVPLKMYEKGEYSDIPVPRKGEEILGVYCSGKDRFVMKGIVNDIVYNINTNWIVVECNCTDIRRLSNSLI